MKNYELIFNEMNKAKENQKNEYQFDKIIKESENINELRKLSSAIKNPRPTTYCFS
ncbi:hypothetical protein [Bacillus thuringiensis]|uniref:hypothetical protein n=1 Tax=Bacillus thuringiensis TaxID=1428 RepID=UPI0016434D3D|nr:hypothetical protein [Bacillus thuringiensis]